MNLRVLLALSWNVADVKVRHIVNHLNNHSDGLVPKLTLISS